MPLVMGKTKPETGHQCEKTLPYLADVRWGISDLPFLQNKDYQYLVGHLYIWRLS